jgi:DNA-binding transcriptional MerR regulator
MPAVRIVLNAFTKGDIHEIAGISVHMLNYLCRSGYLKPSYGQGQRGRVRYFSYRDLVIVQIIQRLRQTGVELARLKRALQVLREDHACLREAGSRRSKPVQWLVTDGRNVFLKHEDGFLDELRSGGQRSFAFVVSLSTMQEDVRAQIAQKRKQREKLKHFDIQNRDLKYEKGHTYSR